MDPTLRIGDRLWATRTDDLKRQDVIVFKPPDVPEIDYIKRVIALAGEQVELIEGRVFIDGARLEEPYAVFTGPSRGRTFGPLIVPAGRIFVLGDNRDSSRDSRTFGTVNRESVVGRATKRFWPPARAGLIH